MKQVLGAAALLLMTACAGASDPQASTTPIPPRTQESSAGPAISKVLTVVEENHGAGAAMREMPYLASLAQTYGRTTAYQTLTHPSLPNYLALAGGSTFGVRDDRDPAAHRVSGASVLGRALALHKTAKTYAEAMPSPCSLTSGDRYAVRHNPWTYFADTSERTGCTTYDVPSGTPVSGDLHDDISAGTLPTVGLLIPDLCHDGHDCGLSTADGWLKGWLPEVMQGPDYRAGRLAIVIAFDEDEGGAKGPLLTVVVAPSLHGRVSRTPLDHLSWARWMTDLVGAAPLRDASAATSLGRAFGL